MKDGRYRSHDFYLVAICVASGASIFSVDRKDHEFVSFTLDIPESEAREIIKRHWNRELKVPTRDLVEAINELKTRLHSGV